MKYGVHLDDDRIDLAGTVEERNQAEHRIENMPADSLGHRFDTFIARPDLTDDPDEICVLFGVPIFGGSPEQVAYDAHLKRLVDRQISHADWGINVRDQALLPSTLPADVVRQRSIVRSVSRQALSILINHSRCLDHVAKCSPRHRISAASQSVSQSGFYL